MNEKSQIKSNINVINSFFSRSFVLVTGILLIAGDLLHSLASTAANVFLIPHDTYYVSAGSFKLPDDTLSSGLVTGVLFILMYIFAKRNSDKIKVPIKIYSVYTYVQFILAAIASFIVPFILIIVAITGNFRVSFMKLPKILTTLIALILISALLLFILMVSYIERRYAKSLDESVTTPSLCKEGAKEYSILCFIFAGISFAVYFISGVYMATTLNHIFLHITSTISSLSSLSLLLSGIIAKKYAIYIPDEEESESFEAPEELTYPNLKTDTSETINPKYIQEIEINNNYKENFYE